MLGVKESGLASGGFQEAQLGRAEACLHHGHIQYRDNHLRCAPLITPRPLHKELHGLEARAGRPLLHREDHNKHLVGEIPGAQLPWAPRAEAHYQRPR